MRNLIPVGIACTLALASALAIAQAAARPGIYAVGLPRGTSAATQVESTALLETPYLKLQTLVVPKGGVVPAHSTAGQISVQALSGVGELRTGDWSERLDATQLVVLAPDTVHEVRAGASADLVLLVHEVVVAVRARGQMGRGVDRQDPGMGRRMRPKPTTPPATNQKPDEL